MTRSNLEYRVAKVLYEEHGIVTFPCVDEGADLETLSGLRIEVKRGSRRTFQAERHGNLADPAPPDLYLDDYYALSCPLTDTQREGSFDYLVMWLGDMVYAFAWDEIAALIYKPMLYIPCRYIQMLGQPGIEKIRQEEQKRQKHKDGKG